MNPSPSRTSRTGGASRPCSSHCRYRSTVVTLRPRRRRSLIRIWSSGTVIGTVGCLFLPMVTSIPFRRCTWCGRVESNHHSRRPRGYSPLSSPVLSVRKKEGRPAGFEPEPRGSRPRMLAVTPRPPRRRCRLRRRRPPRLGSTPKANAGRSSWPRSGRIFRRRAGRIRTGTSRITTSDACRYTTTTTCATPANGDDRTRTGGPFA